MPDINTNRAIYIKFHNVMGKYESIEIQIKAFKLKVNQPSWKGVLIILIVVLFGIIMKYGSLIFALNL